MSQLSKYDYDHTVFRHCKIVATDSRMGQDLSIKLKMEITLIIFIYKNHFLKKKYANYWKNRLHIL